VVLRERPADTRLTMGTLAAELGLPFDERSDAERDEVTLALDHVLTDLAPQGLVDYESEDFTVEYPSTARRFRVEPLDTLWPHIGAGYLEADDEVLLAALARLSERPGIDHADVAEVRAEDVFAALGWDWDGPRAVAIYRNLKEPAFVVGSMFNGYSISARVTYAGLVRALLTATPDHQLATRRLLPAAVVAPVAPTSAELDPEGMGYRPARGRPGRPPWTAEKFWARYRDARARATPPYTYRAIAPHFQTLDDTRGTDPEYVRKLVRRFGLPPENASE
jgi:hypothetical protein